MLLALFGITFWGMSIPDLAIAIVVIVAIVALVYLAFQVFEVAPPPWVVKVFWIVIAATVNIAAIRFVASM